MKKTDVKRQVSEAISACQEKQAEEITILELEQGSGAFTDYFVVGAEQHKPPKSPGYLGRGRRAAGKSRAASHSHRRLQASGMDSARLCRLRCARILREGAQVLRSRTAVEVR